MTAMALQQATTQTHVGTISSAGDGETNMACHNIQLRSPVTSGFRRAPLSITCLQIVASSTKKSPAFGSQVLGINTLLTL